MKFQAEIIENMDGYDEWDGDHRDSFLIIVHTDSLEDLNKIKEGMKFTLDLPDVGY